MYADEKQRISLPQLEELTMANSYSKFPKNEPPKDLFIFWNGKKWEIWFNTSEPPMYSGSEYEPFRKELFKYEMKPDAEQVSRGVGSKSYEDMEK